MNSPHWELDEETGLWKWPVLLNGDWSRWTDAPCTLLWGQFERSDYNTPSHAQLSKVSETLTSSEWPDLTVFRVGSNGFLVLAPSYTSAQTILLAQNINRELSPIQSPNRNARRESGVTWATVEAKDENWDLPCLLQALTTSVERNIREVRLGSIEEIDVTSCESGPSDFYITYGRDWLTNLHSWRNTLALCSRYKDEPVAVMVGNVDRMKHFLDTYGFATGDLVLQLLSHVLRRFESNDVAVFRYGGDEFLIWIRGYSLERAKRLSQQIDAEVSALQIPTPQTNCSCSASLTWGAVASSSRDLDMATLLREAETLMRQAKAAKRALTAT